MKTETIIVHSIHLDFNTFGVDYRLTCN